MEVYLQSRNCSLHCWERKTPLSFQSPPVYIVLRESFAAFKNFHLILDRTSAAKYAEIRHQDCR